MIAGLLYLDTNIGLRVCRGILSNFKLGKDNTPLAISNKSKLQPIPVKSTT